MDLLISDLFLILLTPLSGLIIIITITITITITVVIRTKKGIAFKGRNLPPGPYPWPIIGNIPHLGKKPHISLARLAQSHGPLISLRLGSSLLVVGSTPAAATEILKTHDRLLSGRSLGKATPDDFKPYSVVWDDCTDHWKYLKSLCRTELFSPKALESKYSLRKRKVAQMLDFIRTNEGKAVKIGEIVFNTIFNVLGNVCFSKDFVDLNPPEEEQKVGGGGLKGAIRRILELTLTPNISDFYPMLTGLDLQGLKKSQLKAMDEVYELWGIIIKERRESKQGLDSPSSSSDKQDFLDIMLACGFSDYQINCLALDIFTAGTDTTTSTIEWAMAELLKNKDAMFKIREELRREIGTSNTVEESQISQLPYLHACVKETLRLHSPVPFLIPRRALQTCEVMNYTVPKNTQLFVNVWAIARDPNTWEDPLSFKPERFLDSDLDIKGQDFELDIKGQDFEFLPFGGGRRMCPGFPLAAKNLHFILASLVHSFDWLLPDNMDPLELDMSDSFGVTLQKEQPLLVIPKLK